MDSYLSTVHDFEIGAEFMLYIKRQPTITKEPEDFVFEVFKPEEVYVFMHGCAIVHLHVCVSKISCENYYCFVIIELMGSFQRCHVFARLAQVRLFNKYLD